MKIFLSVGHSQLASGAYTGANGYINEYLYNKEIAPIVKTYLEKAGHSVDLIICPERQFTSNAEERTYKIKIENGNDYDLVCELHLNAYTDASANGNEVYYYDEIGRLYAERISDRLSSFFKKRGAKQNKNLYMLSDTKACAILVESFFCTNRSDSIIAGQNKKFIAKAIAEGIANTDINEDSASTPKTWDAKGEQNESALGQTTYCPHVESLGWQPSPVSRNGEVAGTTNKSLRLEAIKIEVNGIENVGVTYRVHCEDVGWEKWKNAGEVAGSTGRSRRMEAIEIRLTGAMAYVYDVMYRVHCQGIGWMDWEMNGAMAGSVGESRRIEAIQIYVRGRIG